MNGRASALQAYYYDDPVLSERQRFEDRLHNWRKVARTRGWQSATCWSVEGRYVAPPDTVAALGDEDAQEAEKRRQRPNPWPVDPDMARALIADAWHFEDCWRPMPWTFRMILVYAFHRRMHPSRVTYILHIPRGDFDEVLRKARAMLRNRVRTMGS